MGCPKLSSGFKFKEDNEVAKLSKISESSSESLSFDSTLFFTAFGLLISLWVCSFFNSFSFSLSLLSL